MSCDVAEPSCTAHNRVSASCTSMSLLVHLHEPLLLPSAARSFPAGRVVCSCHQKVATMAHVQAVAEHAHIVTHEGVVS